MAWYLAPSLVNLRNEIHGNYPNHKTDSDGSIGDDAHGETDSDHNSNSRGSVNAIDEDVDGLDVWHILDCFKRHPSAHYFIWKPPGQKSQIWDSHNNWVPQTYTGSNPHDKHFHGSIFQTSSAEQNQTSWGIGGEMDAKETHDAIWVAYPAGEYYDDDGDLIKDSSTPKDALYKAAGRAAEARDRARDLQERVQRMENDVQTMKTDIAAIKAVIIPPTT